MQRLFAMFPQGGPGVALVLLRGSLLASFFAIATRHPSVTDTPLMAGVVVVSLCVAAGFVTPVASVIAGAAAAADVLASPHAPGFSVSWVLLLDAAAMGLLGPGAYSIDARLFGRRVTVLPASTDTDD